jgi:hypothetical protein
MAGSFCGVHWGYEEGAYLKTGVNLGNHRGLVAVVYAPLPFGWLLTARVRWATQSRRLHRRLSLFRVTQCPRCRSVIEDTGRAECFRCGTVA